MVRQLEPAFCQCCCQVPDVRHRGWGPTAFREALADGPGRCSWAPVLVGLGKMVSPCPVHWTSGYWEKITPYCICFFLAKKKKIQAFVSVLCLSSEGTLSSSPAFSVLSTKHHSSSAGVGLRRFSVFLVMPEYHGTLSFKYLGDAFLNNENYIFFPNSNRHYNGLYLIDNISIKQRWFCFG